MYAPTPTPTPMTVRKLRRDMSGCSAAPPASSLPDPSRAPQIREFESDPVDHLYPQCSGLSAGGSGSPHYDWYQGSVCGWLQPREPKMVEVLETC
ncbi:hypothetical protein EYF80_017084 [Liparis tanakae]|uniref:Uncharacterized protein n=1 Tax=Liparis tanakae TaxID=230148 RepID=A0A4Z2I5A2_9TELE|nr:hypothetical protein EYF80_017084 [Liparis tanakae]